MTALSVLYALRSMESPDATSTRIGPAWAGLAAWCALAFLNVILAEVLLPWGHVKLGVRAAHHAFDAGHLVALGVVSFGAAWLCQRAKAPRWLALALLAAAGLIVALFTLRSDSANLLTRIQFLPSWLAFGAIVVLAGAGVGLSWWAATWLARPRWRVIPIVIGLGLGVANHLVLPFNYPGVHLFIAWVAAMSLAGAISSYELAGGGPGKRRRVIAIVTLIVLALGGLASILVLPTRTVWRELFRSSGTVLAPLLARMIPQREGEHRPLPIEGSPWFRSRAAAPKVDPTGPPLIEKPVVILITVDALRPDLLAKHPGRFPGLERVRDGGVEFTNARAPSPSTITTVASIFTGKYYSSLYWSEVDPNVFKGMFKGAIMPHADDSPRLAGLLEPAGVKTVHVVPLWGLSRELGVGIGFSEELLTPRDYGSAASAMDLMLERLERAGNDPLFMYVHFVDPHAPYNLAGTHGTEYERYLREVELVDKQITRLMSSLDDEKLGERTIVIVSADHGEAFGEHGTKYHAVTVYEEMVRVPLYVSLPKAKHRVVDTPVTLMDLGPTILDLNGLATPGHFMGESLVPILRGERRVFTRPIATDAGRRMQALYFPNGMKAIADLPRKTQEVYNLSTDPGELDNLVDDESAEANRYLGAMRRFFHEHRLPREGYEPPWRPF